MSKSNKGEKKEGSKKVHSMPPARKGMAHQVLEKDTSTGHEGGVLHGMTKEYSGWDVYNNEAKKTDTELVKDWRESLNSLLLFAAIFAAVLTALIVESKKMLEQDSSAEMLKVLIQLTNNFSNGTHSPYEPEEFQAPPVAVTINSLFFASLCTSLAAALISVIALQWVADYDAAITRGGSSPEDRAKRRQFRYSGVIWWKMGGIIAALPLLLYCSVILFFVGLIIWVSAINQTVGLVVACGGAIVVLFYATTTILAVIFVSAPFKSPLVQWIYSLFVTLVHQVACALSLSSISPSLKGEHGIRLLSRRREDVKVDGQAELGLEAMLWLANQLSISQDSYARLLLLASELPNLALEISQSSQFAEAPWYPIFDLLGWKQVGTEPGGDVGDEELYAMEVMAGCYIIPEIFEIIRPLPATPYVTNNMRAKYWSQYCDMRSDRWFPSTRPTVPNMMYLCLRDIFPPSESTGTTVEAPEMDHARLESIIQVSRWRNSPDKPHKPLNDVLDRVVTSSFFERFISIFSHFLKASEPAFDYDAEARDGYTGMISRIVRILIDGEVEISRQSMVLLQHGFESVLLNGSTADDMMLCLSNPLRYVHALEDCSAGLTALHHDFVLLFAKNLNNQLSGAESIRRVKEVLTMIWSKPYHLSPRIKGINPQQGTELFFDYNAEAIMGRWVDHLRSSPHRHDVLRYLSAAQAQKPDIGPLWRVNHSRGISWTTISTLWAYDNLLTDDVITPAQHDTVIELICRDFEFGPPEAFQGVTESWKSILDDLRDPCLIALVQTNIVLGPGGSSVFLIRPSGWQTDSWIRIAQYLMKHHEGTTLPSVLRYQALLLPLLPNQNELYERALREPQIMSHLQRIFDFFVPCPQHHHCRWEVHLLLHILGQHFTHLFNDEMEARANLPMKTHQLALLPMLLILSDRREERLAEELDMDKHYMDKLLEVVDRVKSSQSALLALIRDYLVLLLTHVDVSAEEVEVMSRCSNSTGGLACDYQVLHLIPQVILHFEALRKKMMDKSDWRPIRDKKRVSDNAIRVMDTLRVQLINAPILGRYNCSMLSCAHTNKACVPAIGWMGVYID